MNNPSTVEHFKGKNILIIGCPASGKTFMANYLTSPNHKTIHTDDYMKYGYNDSLYIILNDIQSIKQNTIIEGVLGYRMLRKGVELKNYYPDIVIEVQISNERMIRTYKEQRPDKDIKSVLQFNANHEKILSDYFAMPNPKKPQWLKFDNEY